MLTPQQIIDCQIGDPLQRNWNEFGQSNEATFNVGSKQIAAGSPFAWDDHLLVVHPGGGGGLTYALASHQDGIEELSTVAAIPAPIT
jgi:hypothetical protein